MPGREAGAPLPAALAQRPPMDSGTTPLRHRAFRWADLATTDDARAADFHRRLFGWSACARRAGRGRVTTLEADGWPFASLYRLASWHAAAGVPSHRLPYVATPDFGRTLALAVDLGANVAVAPQAVAGFARIAVFVDPTGAPLGLWQAARPGGWTAPPVSGDDSGRHCAGSDR